MTKKILQITVLVIVAVLAAEILGIFLLRNVVTVLVKNESGHVVSKLKISIRGTAEQFVEGLPAGGKKIFQCQLRGDSDIHLSFVSGVEKPIDWSGGYLTSGGHNLVEISIGVNNQIKIHSRQQLGVWIIPMLLSWRARV